MTQKILGIVKRGFALAATLLLLIAFLVPLMRVDGGSSASTVEIYLYDLLGLGGSTGDVTGLVLDFFPALFAACVLFAAPAFSLVKKNRSLDAVEYVGLMIGFSFAIYLSRGVSGAVDVLGGGPDITDSSWLLVVYAVFLIVALLIGIVSSYLLEPIAKFVAGRGTHTIASRLKELDDLKANGTISEEEYSEARKAALHGEKE